MAKAAKTRKPLSTFVLDNSIVMAWSFEEANAYADAVLDSLQESRALVPSLWPLEVANSLLVGERRKRINQAESLKWVQILRTLPIAVDEETTQHALTTTLSLAREQALSAYDASYLELAMRHGIPLATSDERLKTAAKMVGVKFYGVH